MIVPDSQALLGGPVFHPAQKMVGCAQRRWQVVGVFVAVGVGIADRLPGVPPFAHPSWPWENSVDCHIIVPMGRRTTRTRATHDRLKTAAVDVFATRGYGVSGVDHIVEQAGTTRGAFYYYFSSKADVARDLQEELWGAAARQAYEASDPEADFLTNVRRGLEAYLAALKNLGAERAFLQEGFAEPSLAMFDGEGRKWGAHYVRDVLVNAMDKGQLPRQDPDTATALLVEALQALTLAALNGDDVTDAFRVVDGLNEALTMAVPAEPS